LDLRELAEVEGVLAVLLFGSRAKGHPLARDVDVCVVAPESEDKAKLLLRLFSRVREEGFDIWLFEELPLYMKVEVIKNHKVVSCRDYRRLYEYFVRVMALWRDQEVRIRNYRRFLT
jgi:hypothetical protein